MTLLGHHHVTAIASDAQRNRNFYVDILGLRLVKVTVNFDDPTAYHLYYGDGVGTPGTILTFFIWKGAFAGRAGLGGATAAAFSIPQASLGYWVTRLQEKGLKAVGPIERFGEKFLLLQDPDGMTVELVADPAERPLNAWEEGPVPPEHAIRGLHGVTLLEAGYEETADFLTKELGMTKHAEYLGTSRFAFGTKARSFIDLKCAPEYFAATMGTGSIHHIAFRTKNDADQKQWHRTLSHHDHNVSPILDRTYFRSIYFREPGGVLFEIATDAPGFTVDEKREALGGGLKLPEWMETERSAIEAALPPFPRSA
ncbi:MAG TPA: ring-cleaving dioxygenase [Candidatus Peribacteria bacterium]|nr:ring-cleaving dioxygenase [Candidatus Peribacteria bacterium]